MEENENIGIGDIEPKKYPLILKELWIKYKNLDTLVRLGFIFLLFMMATVLLDSWIFKNDISKERYELLKEQINNKCLN